MTRYTVVWSTNAQNQLARIWMDALDRQAVTQAAHALDVELATDPLYKGESAEEGLRFIELRPLNALFAVSEPDRIVNVLKVWPGERFAYRWLVNGEASPGS